MTIKEFAAITQKVIAQDGFDEFVPTACYPERVAIRALTGLPDDVEPEPAVVKWALNDAKRNEEVLMAFKSGPSEFHDHPSARQDTGIGVFQNNQAAANSAATLAEASRLRLGLQCWAVAI